jgi:hypothetical protein
VWEVTSLSLDEWRRLIEVDPYFADWLLNWTQTWNLIARCHRLSTEDPTLMAVWRRRAGDGL